MGQLHLILLILLATLEIVLGSPLLGARNSLSSHPPLRCCFMVEAPISFQDERKTWGNGLDGVVKDFLIEHQSHLGWTCSSIVPFNQTDSTDFNAFVETMHECTNTSTGQIINSPNCACDVGIGGWVQNPDRFGKVTFLPPFAYDKYVVFTHVSEATVSGKVWFFLETFDGKAWFCIMSLVVMFTFLKMFDSRFDPPAPQSLPPETNSKFQLWLYNLMKSRLLHRLRKATMSTLTRMLMLSEEPYVQTGNTTRQWFLNLILAVCALFLILSYEASMTASLVQESIETKFRTAADLQSCRIKPSEVCLPRGGAIETYWNRSIATDKCHEGNPPQSINSYDELFLAVGDGNCKYAFALESVIAAAIRMRYCGYFVIVGEPILSNGLSMLIPKGSNLTEAMSLGTLELQRNGTTPSLRKYFNTLPPCSADMDTTLSFSKLRLFFVIAFSFGVIIFLLMVLVPQFPSRPPASTAPPARKADDSDDLDARCTKTCSSSSVGASSIGSELTA